MGLAAYYTKKVSEALRQKRLCRMQHTKAKD